MRKESVQKGLRSQEKTGTLVGLKELVKMRTFRDFPYGPVVKNLPSNAGDAGSIPGQGTMIPRATGQLSLRALQPACHNEEPACCKERPRVPQLRPDAAK